MLQIQLVLDRDARAITKRADQVLGMLAGSDSVPFPVRYQKVTRGLSEIRRMWVDHLDLQSRGAAAIISKDSHFAAMIGALEREGAGLGKKLESISSAEWPHSPAAGWYSLRLRATEILMLLLYHIEKERIGMLPLLRRTASRMARPAIKHTHRTSLPAGVHSQCVGTGNVAFGKKASSIGI